MEGIGCHIEILVWPIAWLIKVILELIGATRQKGPKKVDWKCLKCGTEVSSQTTEHCPQCGEPMWWAKKRRVKDANTNDSSPT